MKEITILGETYQYEINCNVSEYGENFWTNIYHGIEIKRYKRFWLFGRIMKKTVPKLFLVIHFNIEDEKLTKEELRTFLEKEITRNKSLLNRRVEIKKGELI